MSEPKFHVGQHVAVMCMNPMQAIPAAVVVHVELLRAGELMRSWKGSKYRIKRNVWAYAVDAEVDALFIEPYLRPIDPDTEYQETTENEEIEA